MALWEISPARRNVEISLPRCSSARRIGIVTHRRVSLDASDLTLRHGIPVTRPARTLIDIAGRLPARKLEAVVNRADKLALVDPEQLLKEVARRGPFPGATKLRALLDHATFRRTDSELERMFLRLVRKARLPVPETQVRLNGHTVDFYWPGHCLVVETDGLRYHRTATSQARDARRDRAHALAGLTTMRFTHAEVRYEPEAVAGTLAEALRRLEG
jgi:very-short-patch-repair endonuclease